MFACPFLQGFSEHWVDYTSDFPLLPLPKLQQQHIPNHPKMQAKIFFQESHFIEIMTHQRDGGSISLLCLLKPKHMHLSITGTSGSVIFVPGSLPSPTKTSSCSSGPCLRSQWCQMHPAVSLSSERLYRKQLKKSEVMVRKISLSPYLRRYSSPQPSKASNHS